MRELDECLQVAKAIKSEREKLYILRVKVMSPKNQILSDMPKSKGGTNEIENYIIKLEHIESYIGALETNLRLRWNAFKKHMSESGIIVGKDIMRLLELRFCEGNSWNKCAAIMNKEYPNCKWNTNKCFRVYRFILGNLHKNNN